MAECTCDSFHTPNRHSPAKRNAWGHDPENPLGISVIFLPADADDDADADAPAAAADDDHDAAAAADDDADAAAAADNDDNHQQQQQHADPHFEHSRLK